MQSLLSTFRLFMHNYTDPKSQKLSPLLYQAQINSISSISIKSWKQKKNSKTSLHCNVHLIS